MTSDIGRPVLLDTSVLVHLARDTAMGRAINREHRLSARVDKPLVSTVAAGEILGLARTWNWGERKLATLRGLLGQLVLVEAGLPDVVEVYAVLYAEAKRRGESAGENDLWIAATACVTKAELFTCDKDFLWLDPGFIQVQLIEEAP